MEQCGSPGYFLWNKPSRSLREAVAMLMDPPNLILDLAQIRSDARSGKLSVEQLLDIIERQQQTVKRLAADRSRLTQRLAQYEPNVAGEASAGKPEAQNPGAAYSLDAEGVRSRNMMMLEEIFHRIS
jgi:hypothetical protein